MVVRSSRWDAVSNSWKFRQGWHGRVLDEPREESYFYVVDIHPLSFTILCGSHIQVTQYDTNTIKNLRYAFAISEKRYVNIRS